MNFMKALTDGPVIHGTYRSLPQEDVLVDSTAIVLVLIGNSLLLELPTLDESPPTIVPIYHLFTSDGKLMILAKTILGYCPVYLPSLAPA